MMCIWCNVQCLVPSCDLLGAALFQEKVVGINDAPGAYALYYTVVKLCRIMLPSHMR